MEYRQLGNSRASGFGYWVGGPIILAGVLTRGVRRVLWTRRWMKVLR